MSKDVQYRLEYAALVGAAALLNVLPYRAALAVAWAVAGLMFHVLRFRRRETFRRIREVFGAALPRREVRRIAWLSLRNMAFNCVEMMRAPHIDKAWIDRNMPGFQSQVPLVTGLMTKHRGLIFAVPHMGNWDLAGWACSRYGITMFSVAAKQKNPYVNAWISRQREHGITMLERGKGTLKQIIRMLRMGNAFAILPDVRMPTQDLALPFLGGTANLGRGMAMFAISANVPILPAFFTRTGWSKHAFVHFEPLFPDHSLDREEDARRLTAAVVAIVDRAVRENPGQWFWYNKRWVLTPLQGGGPASQSQER
ncbi:MAG: lysophospholipid acyltransferase family protein [Kiritimatiellaeota bacterium]|nr:lysophospholipid acyltransferase family protein [Kiritimatiellota bacterium]